MGADCPPIHPLLLTRLLLYSFFTALPPFPVDPRLLLVHEAIHATYNQDDATVATALNGGTTPTGDASAFINNWLQNNCGPGAP